MRYAIISDIHGNLEALDAVIAALKKEAIDHYLCGGDIVGYGADPRLCIERIQELPAPSIAGNHEWAVLAKLDITYFNPVAKDAILWTREQIDPSRRHFLTDLPLERQEKDFQIVHSTLQNPEYFDYLMDQQTAAHMFSLMQRPVCFIGHTHVPMILRQQGSVISCLETASVKVNDGAKYIVNVGSVGQPRDRDPRAAYCIYDLETSMVEIKRVHYPVELAQQKIRRAGLSEILATRLALGT